MMNTFLRLPIAVKAALLTALLCLVTSLVIVAASYQGSQKLLADASDRIGESLAGQLSQEASGPLLQGDKLNLQALLNQLVANPVVLQATIFDVENQPIAEAGEQQQGPAYSASVTFQDSIAGYTVVTLNPEVLRSGAGSLLGQLTLLAFLMSALAYLAYRWPAQRVDSLLQQLNHELQQPSGKRKRWGYLGQDALQQLLNTVHQLPPRPITPTNTPTNTPTEQALLAVSFAQERVEEQRTSDDQKLLATVCKLYDGEVSITRATGFTLTFSGRSGDNSAPFRALCAGYLLAQLLADDEVNIGLAMDDSQSSDSTQRALKTQRAIDQAMQLGLSAPGLIISQSLLLHPEISDRLEGESISSEAYQVTALSEPYAALLHSQLKALRLQR